MIGRRQSLSVYIGFLCAGVLATTGISVAGDMGGVITPEIIVKEGPPLPSQPMPGGKVIVILEDQLVKLINETRQNYESLNGEVLPPLKREGLLDQAASNHSQSMAANAFVAHCDPFNGNSTPGDRLDAIGYGYVLAGESIVVGYQDAESVLGALLASPGSRELLLSRELWEIGVGFKHEYNDAADIDLDLDEDCTADTGNSGPFTFYWTILLGWRGYDYFPVVIEREAAETDVSSVDLYIYGESWATLMRLRNEDGAWTQWIEHESSYQWALSGGTGEKRVYVTVRDPIAMERTASDTIISTVGVSIVFEDGFESGDVLAWDAFLNAPEEGE